MNFYLALGSASVALFLAMWASWGYGRRHATREDDSSTGVDTVSGALFGLFGLLLAFSFSASASRFEVRRTIAVDEAAAISTAAQRLDVLPKEHQAEARKIFVNYVDARHRYLQKVSAGKSIEREWLDVVKLQSRLWEHSVRSVSHATHNPVAAILLPSLNEMFEAAAARHVAIQTHIPASILVLLVALGCLTAYLAGRVTLEAKSARRLQLIYGICVVATLAAMVDIDYPRMGLIRADNADSLIYTVRANLAP